MSLKVFRVAENGSETAQPTGPTLPTEGLDYYMVCPDWGAVMSKLEPASDTKIVIIQCLGTVVNEGEIKR